MVAKSLAGCDCVYIPQASSGIYSVRIRIKVGIVISNVIGFHISVVIGGMRIGIKDSQIGLGLANGVGVCVL